MKPPVLPAETLERMMEYPWPGNVRELENFVERAMIMYAGAPAIRFDPPLGATDSPEEDLLGRAREEQWDLASLERAHIFSVLEVTCGNQTRAAEVLGIDRRTLYRKLKRYREADTRDNADRSGS